MKRKWANHELVEHWTIDEKEHREFRESIVRVCEGIAV